MKKILLEEINRINELLGTKQKLDEQLSAFIKSLAPTLKKDFLDTAKTLITTRTIRKIDDLTEAELLTVLKSNAAKLIRRNIYSEITSRLSMNATKFASKTSLELLQDLRTLGVKDPDFAAAYLKKFAKDNSVDTADKKFASIIGGGGSPTPPVKPIDFGTNTPLLGTYSPVDYIKAAELDPILGPILKKSGKTADLEEWIKLNMAKGMVSQDELTRLTKDFIVKIPTPSGNLGRKWTRFVDWVFSKNGLRTGVFLLVLGIVLKKFTVQDVVEATGERIYNDEKKDEGKDSTNTKPPINPNPQKGKYD
jgi:hypothetical protein